ncbi:MAG: hypothetical protein HFG26_13090 [Provencibacterium sp.]|jgi:hypothetical protein|nr:hypothetical protein [Provencibacterium sp.]
MTSRNGLRLYNVLFPLWMLLLFPPALLVILPGNFLIDSLVLLLALRFLRVEDRRGIYRKSILKVFCFGFLSDLIGSLLLLVSVAVDTDLQTPFGSWWYENLTNAVPFNPFENIFAFVYVCLAVLLSGACIYFCNLFFSFRRTDLPLPVRRRLSLALTLFTSPYLFLFPSEILYRGF